MYSSKLPYGLRRMGDEEVLVHISEVLPHESGLKCGCVCPYCGSLLQAKLPRTKADYTARFTHHNAEACAYGLETAIHMKAKEIIAEAKKMVLPRVMAFYEGERKIVCKEIEINFSEVKTEVQIDDFIPDVIAYHGNHELLIEIKVTHGIDEIKLEKIRKHGSATLEIDLFDMETDYSPEVLYHEIIEETIRKDWVYNRRKEMAVAEMKREYDAAIEKEKRAIEEEKQKRERIARAEAKKRRMKIQRILNCFDEQFQESKRKVWAETFERNPIWIKYAGWMGIRKNSIPPYINIEIAGDFVFGCDRRVWQTYVFKKYIHNILKKFKENTYPLRVSSITKAVKKDLKDFLVWDLVYLRNIEEFEDLPGLSEVIYQYLKEVERFGFLYEIPAGDIYYAKFILVDPNSVYEARYVPKEISEYDEIVELLNKKDWPGCIELLPHLIIQYNLIDQYEYSYNLGVLFDLVVQRANPKE